MGLQRGTSPNGCRRRLLYGTRSGLRPPRGTSRSERRLGLDQNYAAAAAVHACVLDVCAGGGGRVL